LGKKFSILPPEQSRLAISASATETLSRGTPTDAAVRGVQYRPEIDGLRAFAVLSVVLYHFSIPGAGGGFIGVDVFFVISGFLIGGILWRELESRGTLALTNFYARRVRRLAAAYFVMAIVTLIAAYFILLPFEFREFGKELISSTVYSSNIYFYLKAGYFDTVAENKVLLHTWSLSVEEQFYIFLPAFFLLLRRNLRILVAALTAFFAVSLVLCIVVTRTSHTAAFFLIPFRAWELLAGVLLAIYMSRNAEARPYPQALSWIGLAMLLAATVFIVPSPSFPGSLAILPTAGALLILFNGRQDNLVNRLLSQPVVVFVGLISYSLYLWHWPVITLARYYRGGPGGAVDTIVLLTLAFVLAYLSWRFVEQPVRHAARLRPSVLFAGVAGMSACLLALGAIPYLRNGMPDRFPPAVRAHIDASADFLQDWSRCHVPTSGALAGVEVCPVGPDGPPSFVVWGDSHVRAFQEGIALLARERGKSGLLIWRAGCPPLFDVRKKESAATRQQDEDCTVANARIRQAIPKLGPIESLLLIGRWAYYAEGQGIGIDSFNTIEISSASGGGDGPRDRRAFFETAVLATVQELAKSIPRILVLRQVPEIPKYDSRDAARRIAHGRLSPKEAEIQFTLPRSAVESRMEASERPFRKLAADGTITWLDSWGSFCREESCSALRDGRALYFDNNHVVNSTSIGMRHLFDPVVEKATSAKQSGAIRP
jgi:peptidoglycan/LPS O-acetylase OafA/YrhL